MATVDPVSGETEDDPAVDYHNDDDASHSGQDGSADPKLGQSLPMQKRRRVSRACDECRRKKIKCDGKQPCTHCTVYSYECTYNQPSNRRRNAAPQYVEALEARMHKAEAILRTFLPDINLDDPQLDVHVAEQRLPAQRKKQTPFQGPLQGPVVGLGAAPNPSGPTETSPEGGEEVLLETMVDNSGCLDRDDRGHWDYHGHTSGIILVRRLRKQLGAADVPITRPALGITQMLESHKSVLDSPQDGSLFPTHDLPPRMVARRLCHNALDDACFLMRFVHEPSFFASLERIYDTPADQFTNEETSFLPLLYIVIAVGCLFSDDGVGTMDLPGYKGAIGQGFQFFKTGRQLLEVTDCRDLTSLQAICFMVLFLQSSAKLSTCYSYVGICLRSALRLGLHRTVTADFNPIERELRKRIFWVIRKMDVYVSTLLGLPQMLSEDDIDQEYPMEIDAEFITAEGIMQMPSDYTPLLAGCNAHSRLCNVILKVVKYIYPVKNVRSRSKSDQRYMVSHSKIREIERDLQTWMEELPPALCPGTEVSPQLERIRQLLRISYAHVQMIMYRPFLHYVSSGSQARGVDKRSYACAAACVSVSRNIVYITTGMHKRGLLNKSSWFTMHTTYFAILSLIFFVVENPDSPTAKDGVLKDAMEGKNTLAGLAKKNIAADLCSQSLICLLKPLPEMLKRRQSSKSQVDLKRSAPSNIFAEPEPVSALPEQTLTLRSSTFPTEMMSQWSTSESNLRTMSNNQPSDNGSQSAWMASTPELLTESMQIPEPMSATSMNHPFANQEPSSLAWSQHINNRNNFPDLMPIMFSSDDPFAYPTQPMSTLEDDHFRHDHTSVQFPFDSKPRQPTGMAINHLRSSSRLQSLIPRSHNPGETLSSPDLVSIPNQNFVWEACNFHSTSNVRAETTMQQDQPLPNGLRNLNITFDDKTIAMNMDLGISFGDLFGNDTT
ncbi:uncharacterized protein N7498_001997 [Penicillium cinerascens]|uniref:Zn(2)-C6 fungal-type domain-containing protein n=1 Tax=Penicillium cinerascens TaxID=70096 RepID=A0A9W9N961_9EURO|nr:uncharacterized protein N7498_001997 [Penicillium cinerascens]KAJ5215590.1 hypothetical protein N7498_001997 [Penicillium cinerascens]